MVLCIVRNHEIIIPIFHFTERVKMIPAIEMQNIDREWHAKLIDKLETPIRIMLTMAFRWPRNKTRLTTGLWLLFFTSAFTLVICQTVLISKHLDNMLLIVAVSSTMIISFSSTYRNVCLTYYHDLINQMLSTVKNEFWPINFVHKKEYNILLLTCKGLISLYIACILMLLIWVMFPYIPALPGDKPLGVLLWLPFDKNKSPRHEIIYMHIIWTGIFNIASMIGTASLYCYFTANVVVQFRLLKAFIKSIDNDKTHETAYENLKACINHHVKLLIFCNNIQKVFGFTTGIVILTAVGIFSAIGFLILTENDTERLIKLIGYGLCALVDLTIYCIYANKLQYESESVANACYQVDWLKADVKFRKAIILMILQAQNPKKICGFGIKELNNNTIISTIQTAFSVVTFLRGVQEN